MIISWGKPAITATPVTGTGATGGGALPTPVDGSSELSTEKGEKLEALIEGGEAEAVKYKASKYTFVCQIRFGKDRTMPIDGTDGVVPGEWTLALVPDETGAPGFTMHRAVCSYEESWTSADGGIRTYTFESLKPQTGNQLTWAAASSGSGTP